MSADHGGHAAVQVPAHPDLLARRLGVHVDHDVVDPVAQVTERGVGLGEGRAAGIHEQVPRQRDDPEPHLAAGDHTRSVPRLSAQEIRRPQDSRLVVEVGVDLALPVGVVAERDHVDPGGEHLVGELRRDADAPGDVLAVDDHEIRLMALTQRRQQTEQGPFAEPPDDVSDEQNLG